MQANTILVIYLVVAVGWMLFGFVRLAYLREFRRFIRWAIIVSLCLLWFHYFPVVGEMLQEEYRSRIMIPVSVLVLILFSSSGPFMTHRGRKK
ncbi:hypothetical protein [Desulfurispira natronophila]|uniref:Uncharacterized protein n=1 Tax=Desulfurispira natronophila TaxID=682562 RepID=A0A7W7Y4U3_9BACT|nr:hypothetical protein [Desulfurispira natronophila]MBB5022105.1 hypothetical protein [Desulfurispira natronophila]